MKRQVLNFGKSKVLFRTEKSNLIIMKFLDWVHAGGREEKIAGTGKIRADICEIFFRELSEYGITTHFKKRLSDTEFLVERLTMYKLEIVGRNIAAGSLVKNYPYNLGDRLDPPLINFHLKLDPDPILTEGIIYSLKLASEEELNKLTLLAKKVNKVLSGLLNKKGITLVDFKFEAGKRADGSIVVGDEISCDSARLRDTKSNQSLDKDIFRYQKGDIMAVYNLLRQKIING